MRRGGLQIDIGEKRAYLCRVIAIKRLLANEDAAMPSTQKITPAEKQEFQLHVLLIQRMEKCTKNAALFRAWLEGRKGLQERLAQVH